MGDDAYERTATEEECAGMQDVLRDAMHAGAAGFATSFAFPHRGIDGKPVPSRFADRAELEALLDTMGEVGLGVVSIAPGDPCPPADMFDLQLKVGVPFTWGALLTSPGRNHQKALDANRDGWERGAEVWPQVTPRPLMFQFTLDSPYPLAVNEHFAALQNASIDERARAYADPAWREQMMEGWGGVGNFGLRWDTYSIGQSDVHPELVDRRLADVAAERGVEPLACLLDLALGGARARAPRAHHHRQRRRSRRGRPPGRRAQHLGPLRRRGPRRAALRRAAGDRPARRLGARPRGHADGAGDPQAERPAGRHLRVRRSWRTCARARGPTSPSSIPRRSTPVPSAACATSRRTPSGSPPTSPSACST